MNIDGILELLQDDKEIRPVIEAGAKTLESYGPILRGLIEKCAMAQVDIRAEMVARFESKGFTREEAIYMTMDEWWGMTRKLKNVKTRSEGDK